MPIQVRRTFRGQIPMPQAYVKLIGLGYTHTNNMWTSVFGVYANADLAQPDVQRQAVPDHMKVGKKAKEIAEMEEQMPTTTRHPDPLETFSGPSFEHEPGVDPFAKAEELLLEQEDFKEGQRV